MATALALIMAIVNFPLLARAEPPSEQQKYSPLGLALPTANQQTYMSWELEVRWTSSWVTPLSPPWSHLLRTHPHLRRWLPNPNDSAGGPDVCAFLHHDYDRQPVGNTGPG